MSEQNNIIHFDPLTAVEVKFACHLMFQFKETNEQFQTLPNAVDTLSAIVNLVYSKTMDREKTVIEKGAKIFELNEQLVKTNE